MLFPTVKFAIFFVVVFTGNWLLMQRPRPWRWFMLAASYFFYGFWDWRFVFLLAGATLVNQLLAVLIHRAPTPRARRWYLVGALAADLGVLGYFKYVGFLMASVIGTLDKVGLHIDARPLEVILPIGISFFTFQAMSYVVDVYRERIPPAGWLDFAVYLSFFPHLVAGPIVRGAEYLPQLHPPRDPRHIDSSRAFYLIFIGLAKKIVIADFLASHIVKGTFDTPDLYSGLEVLFGIYAFAIQIYADFSAYSDIAIGLALLLGFKFPENFNAPYTAVSITDFWRRWHMTLSRWLRDYLYIPLGGNKGGRLLTYRNLMLTMLLGGLWHGAAWRFVVWGGLHGLWLAAERAVVETRRSRGLAPLPDTWWLRAVKRVATFHLVCLAWVFFRADSLATAGEVLRRIFTGWGTATTLLTPAVLVAIAVGLAAQYVPRSAVNHGLIGFSRLRPAIQGVLLAFTLMVIDALGPEGVAAFIYFQF
ncbi:MAG: putative poly(beta-D-mannuronate) O-acetylase [Acidobacteria bacterium]|nr:putative poly(beta-D-mannuronate) O-acetylase [Acidobacteriota bacterium]